MAKSKLLKSERLELHPFCDRFLNARYVGWLNDPQTVRYSEQRHRSHTLKSCAAYAQSFDTSPHYFWAVVAHDAGHIGNLTATIDVGNRVADLAILIGEPKSRGLGLGAEAWRCAIKFLLTDAGMRKVSAGTMAENHAMLRVMRDSGMIEEGRRSRQFLLGGKQVDLVLAAIFAEDIDGRI